MSMAEPAACHRAVANSIPASFSGFRACVYGRDVVYVGFDVVDVGGSVTLFAGVFVPSMTVTFMSLGA